jgi:hypothetical protein
MGLRDVAEIPLQVLKVQTRIVVPASNHYSTDRGIIIRLASTPSIHYVFHVFCPYFLYFFVFNQQSGCMVILGIEAHQTVKSASKIGTVNGMTRRIRQ